MFSFECDDITYINGVYDGGVEVTTMSEIHIGDSTLSAQDVVTDFRARYNAPWLLHTHIVQNTTNGLDKAPLRGKGKRKGQGKKGKKGHDDRGKGGGGAPGQGGGAAATATSPDMEDKRKKKKAKADTDSKEKKGN